MSKFSSLAGLTFPNILCLLKLSNLVRLMLSVASFRIFFFLFFYLLLGDVYFWKVKVYFKTFIQTKKKYRDESTKQFWRMDGSKTRGVIGLSGVSFRQCSPPPLLAKTVQVLTFHVVFL